MRRVTAVVLMASMALFLVGCSAHIHTIGKGAQGDNMTQERQWYVLWGLVPINKLDAGEMAGDATDYTIKTEQSALDVIINIFTSLVTVYSRTVTVTE